MHLYPKDPRVWGPHFWYVMFSSAHNLPEQPSAQHIADFQMFLRSMQSLIPCKHCRDNYTRMVSNSLFQQWLNNPNTITSREDAINIVQAMRDTVHAHKASQAVESAGSAIKWQCAFAFIVASLILSACFAKHTAWPRSRAVHWFQLARNQKCRKAVNAGERRHPQMRTMRKQTRNHSHQTWSQQAPFHTALSLDQHMAHKTSMFQWHACCHRGSA